MFEFQSIILIAVFVQGSLSQLIFDGQCSAIESVEPFYLDDYMGLWFAYAKYPLQSAVLENRKCVYDNYTNLGDNKLSINGAGIFIDSGIETFTLWDAAVKGPGQFAVLYDENQSLNKVNYHVLGTDYDNYTVIYNCENVNSTQYRIDVWIFSRKRFLDEKYAEIAKEILKAQNVDVSILEYYNQTNCPDVTES